MKLSRHWLKTWVDPSSDPNTLSEALTMAGLEVESVNHLDGAAFDKVFVGEVLSAEPHPNADRLRICTVSLGQDITPLSIVCGAQNVRAGLKVAVATIGAVLPGNFKIKEAKIRGLASYGMICSSSELQLTETSEGIMELPHDAPVGMLFAEYCQLPDDILDVSLTPNRGDCLSVQGMAREIGAIFDMPLTPPALHAVPHTIEDVLTIQLQAPTHCPRYVGRVIRNLNPKAMTPLWMVEYLRRSGIRSIHPIVDVTNYVMLELGQPMHAFDLAQLSGEIHVRESRSNEQVTLLDGQTITLAQPTLVIADAEKILAIAGVMGGASSAVSETTTEVFLESAFFTPETISHSLRHYPIHSDSSHRFERGVDPELTQIAMHRATSLLLSIAGGVAGPVVDQQDSAHFPKPHTILLRTTRITRILGVTLDTQEVERILYRLGMQVARQQDDWEVTVPSYRFDLRLEVDLIEELARIHGYHHLPYHAMSASLTMTPCPESIAQKRIRDLLVDRGYHESIHYSFIQPILSQQINPQHAPIPLRNPISAEMSVMRTSLWPNLLETARFNLRRQQPRLQLFEIGTCFFREDHQLTQPTLLAGILLGATSDEQWAQPSRAVDFFDLKGDVEALLALTRSRDHFIFSESTHPALHPGRAADIQKEDKIIGHLGALHPNLVQALDLEVTPYLFEIDLAALKSVQLPNYAPPSKYPSITRDLAFIVEKKLPYQKIRDIIHGSAGNTLKRLQLFDVYEGKGIDVHQKSVALHLTFQLDSRTLTDKEVDETVAHIIATLTKSLQATLRE